MSAERSDDVIRTLESDKQRLINNAEMLKTQYSSLNKQLHEMTRTITNQQV